MRGRRAFIVLTIYLRPAGADRATARTWIVEPTRADSFARRLRSGRPVDASAIVGQAIFALLSIFQLIARLLPRPASTAGAISLEREKQTLDLLVDDADRVGRDRPRQAAQRAHLRVLLIVASIPMTALVFMFGGVGPRTSSASYIVLLATAIALGVDRPVLLRARQAHPGRDRPRPRHVLALTVGTVMLFIFWTAS